LENSKSPIPETHPFSPMLSQSDTLRKSSNRAI
jgi:hypothetical protein